MVAKYASLSSDSRAVRGKLQATLYHARQQRKEKLPVYGDGSVSLSANMVDDVAIPGTIVGTFKIVNHGSGPWIYTLLDSSGDQFAIDGADLTVGATPLTVGVTAVKVQATNGRFTFVNVFVITIT